MINKRGFTLVELISVIGILALLMILMIPTINNISRDSNKTLSNARIDTVTSNAETYAEDRINDYQKCNSSTVSGCTININDLVETLLDEGYIEEDSNMIVDPDTGNKVIVDPMTNKPFSGNIIFCYDKDNISIKAHYVETTQTYTCP